MFPAGRRPPGPDPLADFRLDRHVWLLTGLALPIGAAAALVALALLHGIGLVTNLLWFGRLSTDLVPPGDAGPSAATVLIPVAGGLVVGVMARVGSEGIRGHGIPEAIENILANGSRVRPRLAILKPLSSVISIGSGGPFGAEGPIILTGGALGSLVAQLVRLSSTERRTLLVAGAAGGMTGVFGTPVAATLLAVELLLFEWRPRSMVPAAAAAGTATVVRAALADAGLIAPAPLFPVADVPVGQAAVAGALAIGVAGGAMAWVVTRAVYGSEDAFRRLPLHWAWWPAVGGLVVGLGGLVEPRALGVGYATLGDELAGRLTITALVAVVGVKLVIWSVALGSGTSGGVLAPLLLMGAGVGGVLGAVLPGGSGGLWCLLGMAAALAGVMRSPLTAIVFALELTHDVDALPPLLVVATIAYLVSVLSLRRSILTEKVARRGVHVSREYASDPLEALRVREVMRTAPAEIADRPGSAAAHAAVGPDDTLRHAADRMAEHGVERLPVVVAGDPGRVVGVVTPLDLFRAHVRRRDEETLRERGIPGRLDGRGDGSILVSRTTSERRAVMVTDLTHLVGYEVREADGRTVLGTVEGATTRGLRLHGIPGHRGAHAHVPGEAIGRVDEALDTVVLRPGIGLDELLGAPSPPGGDGEAWHMSDDWWADLLGHYGLYSPEGRGDGPFLHPGRK